MRNDRDEVKEMLRARIEDLCRRLLPEGKRQGRLWVSYNPVTSDWDRSTPELKIGLTVDIGAWKDWRSGDKGDVFGLISYIHGHTSFTETMRWARDFLGLNALSPEARAKLEREARKAKAETDARAAEARLWKIRKAEEMFLSGLALSARSAAEAHGRAYWAARQCPIEAIAQLDETSFRFHHAAEYWTLAEYRSEQGRRIKIKDGPRFPAIFAALRAPTGQTTGLHATFLDPLAPTKAAIAGKPSKLMFGEAKGAVIRLTHGPEGEPPETARAAHPLILCEGVETGLSLALACPEARVWAAGSLSNMANAPVQMDCVKAVLLARDNNEGNEQAERQLMAVLDTLAACGKPIAVLASTVGDDFNDLMRGEDA